MGEALPNDSLTGFSQMISHKGKITRENKYIEYFNVNWYPYSDGFKPNFLTSCVLCPGSRLENKNNHTRLFQCVYKIKYSLSFKDWQTTGPGKYDIYS